MKKQFITGILVFVFSFGLAYAGKEKQVSKEVRDSFFKEFFQAEEVHWEILDNYIRVSFKMNDQPLTALYYQDGELIAVMRHILSDHLPMSLFLLLKKDYRNFWITDLVEVNSQNNASYLVSLESEDRDIMLKSDMEVGWEIFLVEKHKNTGLH